MAAGYRRDRGQASRLQRDPSISQRVAELVAERDRVERESTVEAIRAAGVTKTQVLRELAAVAFSDIGDVLDFEADVVRLRVGIHERAETSRAGDGLF